MSQTNDAAGDDVDVDSVFDFDHYITDGPDRFAALREAPRMGYVGYVNLPDDHPIRDAVADFVNKWYDGTDQLEMAGTVGGVFFAIAADRTDLSLAEATALVLAENPELTWADAADLMEIATGTYKGKMSNEVRPKVERADRTTTFADALGGWDADQ